MFPLKDAPTITAATAASQLDTAQPATSESASAPEGATRAPSAAETPPTPKPVDRELLPAERLGTSPIRFAVADAPAPEARRGDSSVATVPEAATVSPLHRPPATADRRSDTDATILADRPAGSEPPAFRGHQFQPSSKRPGSGGRVLVVAAIACAAILLLGGGAWALTRSGDTTGDDTAAGLSDGEEAVGQQGGTRTDGDDQGLTAVTDPTGSTSEASGGGGDGGTGNAHTDTGGRTETTRPTTDQHGTTATTDPTTETTPTTTKTGTAKEIAIIAGPRVNTRNNTSFQFDYMTNDVCGTGSFTVTEKATGHAVGSFRGEDICFGPRHGGFPGHSSFPGFSLKPGTTYKVSVSVRGTASDGSRTAGTGTAHASFEVTTTGTATTTPTTTEPPPETTEATTGTTGTTATTADEETSPPTGDDATATPPEEESAAPAGPGSTAGG